MSASLTPHERNKEVAAEATRAGLINGFMTLIPTVGAVALAMKNPGFVKRTNWQSRTALAIMPPLFVFGITSEHKLSDRMHEIAHETRHSRETVQWAEEQMRQQRKDLEEQRRKEESKQYNSQEQRNDDDLKLYLTDLYQQSVQQSGVRIVPGNRLSLWQEAANYVAENPIKVLAAVAVPSAAAIFYGRTGKEHLSFSVKLMHTRVFGQFATISLLLTVVGFKEFMDRNGKYITEADADARVQELHQVRTNLMAHLERQQQIQDSLRQEIEKAQEEDVRDGTGRQKKAMHTNKGQGTMVHA